MSNQIPVLYTEQKKKKVKIWLDGHLVPRPTLNSARLISAGKHELDVIFYSSIDEIQPGREFETDRYLITVEESNNDQQQACPRPSFAVTDPTMKNKPKSTGFVPPRLVPKPAAPPPPMVTLERHNPHEWGFAGTTAAMKRNAYNDEDQSSHVSKASKFANFIPPAFRQPEPVQSHEQQQQQRSTLFSDAPLVRLINEPQPLPQNEEIVHDSVHYSEFPVEPVARVSWSMWDNGQVDEEDNEPAQESHDKNIFRQPSAKQTYNWHTLVVAAQNGQIDKETKTSSHSDKESMPKFDFDENSLDAIFDSLDE